MPADILIPVHNGKPFIFKSVSSALNVAEIINSKVIVSSNFCTDGTDLILSSIDNPRLKILKTEKFLTAGENYQNCLLNSYSEYVISIGADDKLNIFGQSELFAHFKAAKIKPSVLFGYDEIIDVNDQIRRSHEHSWHWKKLTQNKIIQNSFSGRNPNLNGAWIRRDLINSFINKFRSNLIEPSFLRVNDLYLWNYICSKLFLERSIYKGYTYIHTPTVYYREYFESYQKYRSSEIEKSANQGRIDFMYYCIEKVKRVKKKFQSECRAGVKIYARNNFINLYFAHGEHTVAELFKELQANNMLGLLERFWLLSSASKISQRIFLSCIFMRQICKSFFVSIIQKRRF